MSTHLREAWRRTAAPDLTFRFGGDAVGDGQYNGWVAAFVGGEKAGYFDWSVWDGEPGVLNIRMIEVDPKFRRQGIASAMVEYVVREQFTRWGEPRPKINTGMRTDEGGKWWDAYSKTALPTWRGFQADEEPFWHQYDAVIATQMRGRQRYYEVWTYGQTFGSFPRLDAAKAALEAIYGPLDWEHRRMEKVPVVHYYYGPTTEFTDPLNIYFVSKLPKLGTYKNLSNKRVAKSNLRRLQ